LLGSLSCTVPADFRTHRACTCRTATRDTPHSPAPPWTSPGLRTEGRVTLIDGILAAAILAGLALNAALAWWWADPLAGYFLVFYAVREAATSSATTDRRAAAGYLYSPEAGGGLVLWFRLGKDRACADRDSDGDDHHEDKHHVARGCVLGRDAEADDR
jgi:hypothetical protein